ncbi:MAG: aminodeoxychorismate/anthranilate synthase component II [Rhodospirillaceae bacterium]|nr:aminodeoxychorismate/anthranilate synthase component II [Rhodospirillaceae bacterium]|tara:strand:- start:721 stop:1305 length:585 start_codon:yes stop_codon:yes gene_type:complete
MYVLIDNYDSFTYNLLHFLGELGAEVAVYRNDAITPEEVLDLGPEGIVLSPGPCDPDRAGICVDLVGRAVGKVPVLGVCLGHQSIAQAFGANIGRAPILMHGKVSNISHFGTDIFKDIQSPFSATRYHSLIVEKSRLPNCLEVTAESDDGLIMGLSHKEYPIFGVQFHPESIASENGHELLNNFLKITKNGENN